MNEEFKNYTCKKITKYSKGIICAIPAFLLYLKISHKAFFNKSIFCNIDGYTEDLGVGSYIHKIFLNKIINIFVTK